MNSINSIPAGELDGGRVSLSAFGRRTSNTISLLSLIFLGFGALDDSLAQYWLLLALILQRGPIPPLKDEITKLPQVSLLLCIVVLSLPLLVLLPFPVLTSAIDSF
eukprot:TRINITY_DN5593_c0_g1_i1.p2 TRINITY_DN5593_c0_g1~~TRINITY_DN5593_c0_g1_i1.p2  ORF type:complete len:106 (+),score=11.73 TRINITY_DN5593_c0_g1_i1:67-384(+)